METDTAGSFAMTKSTSKQQQDEQKDNVFFSMK
jgi:hypothetical protein